MTSQIKAVITVNDDLHDSNDVRWDIGGGKIAGFGYQGKKDGRLHVMRCPVCSKENYAVMVALGHCAWCGFDPNA